MSDQYYNRKELLKFYKDLAVTAKVPSKTKKTVIAFPDNGLYSFGLVEVLIYQNMSGGKPLYEVRFSNPYH